MRTKGTSIREFFDRFPNEQACIDHIFSVKLRDGFLCPDCDKDDWWAAIGGTKKYRHRCGKQVSVLQDTVLFRSNLNAMALFYTLLLYSNSSNGVRSSFIRKQLGLGIRSAHRLCNRVRLLMASYARPKMLGGPGKIVYVDEVHLNFVRPQHGSERAASLVLGLACDDQVLTGIVADRTSSSLVGSIERLVVPGSQIVTDAYASYHRLSKNGWDHVRVDHSKAFHNFRGYTTNPIELYWSLLKRNIHGYRQVATHNLWLFLAETESRYNCRSSDRSIFDQLIERFPPINASTVPALEARFDWRKGT